MHLAICTLQLQLEKYIKHFLLLFLSILTTYLILLHFYFLVDEKKDMYFIINAF